MKVGSLVELIDDSNWRNIAPAIFPVKHVIYTVRLIECHPVTKGIFILLDEIHNRNYIGNAASDMECGFRIDRFRELLPPLANIEQHIKENTLEPELI